jgi:hypothetical protein
MIRAVSSALIPFAILFAAPLHAQSQSEQIAAYNAYWQPVAKRRFNHILPTVMENLRLRAAAQDIGFPQDLVVRTITGAGSPKSYLNHDLIVVPEEYLYQIISRSEKLAILEPLVIRIFSSADFGSDLLLCYTEVLVDYDYILGSVAFQNCRPEDLQIIADMRSDALAADRNGYYSDLYYHFDEAVEFMIAHEAAHFALGHVQSDTLRLAHAQEYAADIWASRVIDTAGVDGASVVLMILALGQPGFLSDNMDSEFNRIRPPTTTHPETLCRALAMARHEGGVTGLLQSVMDDPEVGFMFAAMLKWSAKSVPDLDAMTVGLGCDAPDGGLP